MKRNTKRIIATSLIGFSTITPIFNIVVAHANGLTEESNLGISKNMVVENKVSQDEYDEFGNDSNYVLVVTDEIVSKIKNGEIISIQNIDNPELFATVRFNWSVGNKNWGVSYTGLDSKVYTSHVKVTNKFIRNGGTYTGTLHDMDHFGFTSKVSASGKVGPIAGTIKSGDVIYLKVTQSGKTLYNSGYANG